MAQRQIFRITDFTGGWNPDQSSLTIADNEATEAQNVRFDQHGSILSRQGFDRFISDDSLEASELLAIGRWRNPDNHTEHKVLVTEGESMWHVNLGNDTFDLLWDELTDNVRGDFAPFQKLLLYSNGEDRPLRFDGTNVYELGMDGPSSAPGTTLIAGTLSGTFLYAYTYYDAATGFESNPSPTAQVSPSNEGVQLALVESDNPRITHIRIYRTNDGGSTLLFRDQVANTTGDYDDDGSGSLGLTTPAFDNDPPPDVRYLGGVRGYLFGGKGQDLWWSKALTPDAWPALNHVQLPFVGNDEIHALIPFEDTLLIFGHTNILLVSGSGGNWSINRANVELGAANQRSVIEVEGKLIFLSAQGLYVFPGFTPFAPKLNRLLASFPHTTHHDAAAVYVPEERSVWFSINGRTYSIYIPTSAPSVYTFTSPGFLAGGNDGFSLPLFLDSEEGYVNGYGQRLDLGELIPIQWTSKAFQLANPELTKHFRRIGAYATTGSSSVITITITDQANTHSVVLESVFVDDAGIWDESLWDEANFAAEGISYFIASLPAHRLIGQSFQATISSLTDRQTEISPPISFEYRESNRFMGR